MRGGLFPLCFGIGEAEVPEPLRGFQLTHFDREDFMRLAKDVAKLAYPSQGWTPEHEQAFELNWPTLKTSVDHALGQPDDGVHTTRGFIHEVAGGWWERVKSQGDATKLSWMWFAPFADGTGQTITARGFGEGGSEASRWQTDLISIDARSTEPMLYYYWEGRHPRDSNLLFGGKGWVRFTISSNGRIDQGSGEFANVCISEARPPTTKLVDLQRATPDEIAIMTGKNENERHALAARKLQTWP
jgi:hypothetical protein